jgi:hypothetical protein
MSRIENGGFGMGKKEEITTEEIGYAAGILIGMQEKMVNGSVSNEDIKQFEKAVETLKPFSPEELIEIMKFATEIAIGGEKSGH